MKGSMMLYGNYDFSCRLENEAILPAYKGSTFRGVFGHAMKRVVCALKQQECDQCLLQQSCLYSIVFEKMPVKNQEFSRIAAPPHPFVIEPPLTTQAHFPAGSQLEYSVLLFGEVNNSLPYFIYAFDQVGKIGIGKRINGERGHFVLERVILGKHEIYSNGDQKLNLPNKLENLTLNNEKSQSDNILKVKITLETPLRLKFKNQLKADLPFHVLVRAMLRRISSLLFFYGDGEPALDYRGLVQRANNVKTTNNKLKWFDWRRYSHRQDRSMLMGGMIGTAAYEGNLGEYLPLIELSSMVHLGKQTSFGLGKIKWEILK
jgi:hypothetical protein